MEKMSIWISFGVVAAIVGTVALWARLHSSSQARDIRSMNALFIIAPYKYEGMWVFDDPAVGLSKEPFISGIDTMIDKAVAKIPNAEQGFRAIFSATQFPGTDFKLGWCR